MGRQGRDRAKQAKVARELKYTTWDTDLQALSKELAAETSKNRRSGRAKPADRS